MLRCLLEGAGAEPPASVFGDLQGDSAITATLRQAIQRASRAPFPVLIEGESGRYYNTLFVVNLPPTLLTGRAVKRSGGSG